MLNDLDFSWVVRATLERPRATWQQRLEELAEFKKANGHFKVDPISMPHLNKFCLDQRYRLRLLQKNDGKDVTKRMGPERVEALAAIGFSTSTELLDKHDGLEQTQEEGTGTIDSDEDANAAKGSLPQRHENTADGTSNPESERNIVASV
eukprot:scaffold8353_cov138-Cylindrotheca_fusiformis.AAC.36